MTFADGCARGARRGGAVRRAVVVAAVAELASCTGPPATVPAAGTVVTFGGSVPAGANDLAAVFESGRGGAAYASAAASIRRDVGASLSRIRVLRGAGLPVIVLGYWNVVEDGDVGRSDYGADGAAEAAIATDQANTALRQAAQAAVAVFLDTSDALNGDDGDGDPTDLLTSDGDHPNRRGHEAIAQAVYSALPDPKHGPVGLGAPAAQGCLSRYPVGSQDPGRR